jgi:hypothetical protein
LACRGLGEHLFTAVFGSFHQGVDHQINRPEQTTRLPLTEDFDPFRPIIVEQERDPFTDQLNRGFEESSVDGDDPSLLTRRRTSLRK